MSGDDLSAFASLLNARVAADARIQKAKAFGWLCAGVSVAVCLASFGAMLAMLGYSYMLSIEPSADLAAKAVSDALNKATIRTAVSGVMELATSELTLTPGQSVKLAEGTSIRVDPASSIRVIADVKNEVPQPSKRQLQLDAITASKDLPFTRYTVFKSTAFGAGVVVTGWNFELADPARPQGQRCYYEQLLDKGIAATQTLAFDGTPRRPSGLTKLSFDFDAALANCIWFSGL